MRLRFFLLGLLCAAAFAIRPSDAADAAADWSTILRVAAERQHVQDRQQADWARHQAEQERADGWLAAPPSIDGLYRTDQPMSQQGAGELQFGVRLPLRRPGQTQAWSQLAEQTALDADSRARASSLALLGQLRGLAWDWRLATNRLHAAQTRHTQIAQQLRATEKRVEQGDTAAIDAQILRTRVLESAALLAAAQTDAEARGTRWQAATGLTTLPSDLGRTPIPERLQRLTDANELIHQQPLLAHLADQINLAGATLTAARAEGAGAPELGLAIKRDRSDRYTPWDNSLQLSLSLPIGGETYRAPQLAELNQQKSAAQISLIQTTQALWGDILELRARVAAWPPRVALLNQRAALAETLLKKQQRAFALGEIDGMAWRMYEQEAADAALMASEAQLLAERDASQLKQAYGVLPTPTPHHGDPQ